MQYKHTFVVPAYQESPYLDACLWSLKQQTVKSRIVIVTSTPNALITAMAEKYHIPVVVNPASGSIAADWNFALQQGGKGLLTLAHQDDLYTERYAESCMKAAEKHKDALLVFTDYAEIIGKGGAMRSNTAMLQIKRLLLLPYLLKPALRTRFFKRAVLRFGSPICCPSVCLNLKNLPNFHFSPNFSVNMDWDAWLRISDMVGAMIYIPERFCLHRIHSDSETSRGLHESRRQDEDLCVFQKLWPKPVAHIISRVYALSYKSNAKTDEVGK